MSIGRHCIAKYLLKRLAFSLKLDIYLSDSVKGGMFETFLLFKSFLKAVQKHFGPVLGLHILSPNSLANFDFLSLMILFVSRWVWLTRACPSWDRPLSTHFLKTLLFFRSADFTYGVIQGASLSLMVICLFGIKLLIIPINFVLKISTI